MFKNLRHNTITVNHRLAQIMGEMHGQIQAHECEFGAPYWQIRDHVWASVWSQFADRIKNAIQLQIQQDWNNV